MIKRDIKPRMIKISDVIVDKSRNVRDLTDSAYDLEPLIQDLQMRGQQDAVTLEKVTDKLYPLKGFRRSEAMAIANQRGLMYGPTAGELAGKPMDSVLAFVYEGLTERERVELLLDHGQRKGLSKVELQNAFERALTSDYSEVEIITLLWTLLMQLYPSPKNVGADLDKSDKDYDKKLRQLRLEEKKGVLQTAKRIWKAPTVLREACYRKLRGEQKWPTNEELKDLSSIHSKEMDENALYSKENPGPKFKEAWARVEAANKDSGGTRGKASSMRNRAQVEDSIKNAESPITKAFQKIQLGEIPVDRLPVLDRICNGLWNGGTISAEDKTEIESWFKKAE